MVPTTSPVALQATQPWAPRAALQTVIPGRPYDPSWFSRGMPSGYDSLPFCPCPVNGSGWRDCLPVWFGTTLACLSRPLWSHPLALLAFSALQLGMRYSLSNRPYKPFPYGHSVPSPPGVLEPFCPVLYGTARPLTGSVLCLFGGWRPVSPSLYCFPGCWCPFFTVYGRMWPFFFGCHGPRWPPLWLPHQLFPAFVCVCHVILASIIYWR